jgi:hypothetical protein
MYTLYMSHGVTVWRYLGTPSKESMSLAGVKELVLTYQRDDKEQSEAAANSLHAISKNVDDIKHTDCDIFLPIMQEIDAAANSCFKAYEGCLGARQPDYEEALRRYRDDVILILEEHFASEEHRSAEEKRKHEDVMARTYAWLSDTGLENLPMPLMTGSVMDRVWNELSSAKDGYSEVSGRVREKETTHSVLVAGRELVRMSVEDDEDIRSSHACGRRPHGGLILRDRTRTWDERGGCIGGCKYDDEEVRILTKILYRYTKRYGIGV